MLYPAPRADMLAGNSIGERHLQLYIWVSLGSAAGGFARYWCSTAITQRFGSRLPWGTLGVNTFGSLALGFLAGLVISGRVPATDAATALMAGVIGSFTTVSSFGLETLDLLKAQEWWRAALNVGLTLVLCLALVGIGLQLGLSLSRL